MILLYPLVLAVAIVIIIRGERSSDGYGWQWFGAWTVAGALLVFSFLTGFSIGLFVLPFAAAVLIWTARRAPHGAEALGFVAGAGLDLLLVASLNGWLGWYIAGLVTLAASVSAYTVARRPHAVR